MKVLAIESSAKVASVALLEDETLIAEYSVNNKLTHSQTLMPMLQSAMEAAQWTMGDVDIIGVANGPGSFTGLRIGCGMAKGLAFSADIPVAAVSTLEAMAFSLYGCTDVICPMMDARRHQVYTGLYTFEKDELITLVPPAALSLEEVCSLISKEGRNAVVMGDGVSVYFEELSKQLGRLVRRAPAHVLLQRAASVGALALRYAAKGMTISAAALAPEYLRLPQAERERLRMEAAG